MSVLLLLYTILNIILYVYCQSIKLPSNDMMLNARCKRRNGYNYNMLSVSNSYFHLLNSGSGLAIPSL